MGTLVGGGARKSRGAQSVRGRRQEHIHYIRRSLMGHGGRRPVPLKHSKTCDSFNEKSSSGTPLIEEEPAREEVPVKKSKIWPLRQDGRIDQSVPTRRRDRPGISGGELSPAANDDDNDDWLGRLVGAEGNLEQ